jgi:hypothetical protein
MSGTLNPLLRQGYEDDPRYALGPQNQLGPTLADAWSSNVAQAGDWVAQQRAISEQRGLWGPGGITPAGVQDAAGQVAMNTLLSTTAPGFRAYHGSPHNLDQFSSKYIGTGEGAQAYSHGLYFAGDEAIGRYYRDSLSTWDNKIGQRINEVTGLNNLDPADLQAVQQIAMGSGLPVDQAARMIAARSVALRKIDAGPMTDPKPTLEKLVDAIRADKNAGHMYEVNINAEPEHFLDWDKPLTEQHPNVQAALSKLNIPNADKPHVTGQAAYHHLVGEGLLERDMIQKMLRDKRASGDTRDFSDMEQRLLELQHPQAAASATLMREGIPGVRYLDSNSRAMGAGKDTRNTVVFDDKLIELIRKYGIAAVLGGGAAAGAAGGQPGT